MNDKEIFLEDVLNDTSMADEIAQRLRWAQRSHDNHTALIDVLLELLADYETFSVGAVLVYLAESDSPYQDYTRATIRTALNELTTQGTLEKGYKDGQAIFGWRGTIPLTDVVSPSS